MVEEGSGAGPIVDVIVEDDDDDLSVVVVIAIFVVVAVGGAICEMAVVNLNLEH